MTGLMLVHMQDSLLGHNSPIVVVDVTQPQLHLRGTEVVAMSEEDEGGHEGNDKPCQCHQGDA